MSPVEVGARLANGTWSLGPDGSADGTLRLSNPSTHLAFFLRVRLVEESGSLRSSYDDNYVSLLPGESRVVTAHVETKGTPPETLHLEVSGWNCAARTLEVRLRRP